MRENQKMQPERLWNLPFSTLFLVNLLTSVGFYMTSPTLPKYAVSVGFSLTLAGVLTGIFSIVAIVVRPVIGAMADRRNAKWILVAATLMTSLAALGYSWSRDTVSLFAFRILHGACFAASSTVQLAMTSNMVPPSRMAEGIGQMGISSILAMTFAPSLGLSVSESSGYTVMFTVSALLIFCAGVLTVFLPYRKPTAGKAAERFSWRNLFLPELFLLAVIGALFSLTNGVTSSFVSMLGDERSIANASLFFTVSALAVLSIRPFIGRIIDRNGWYFVLIPSLIIGAVSMFGIGSARSLPVLLAAAVLKGLSQSTGQTAIQAECAKRSGPERRGVAMATYYLGGDLGNSAGSSLGGWLSQTAGYGNMFYVIGLLVAGGLALAALQRGKDKKERAETR